MTDDRAQLAEEFAGLAAQIEVAPSAPDGLLRIIGAVSIFNKVVHDMLVAEPPIDRVPTAARLADAFTAVLPVFLDRMPTIPGVSEDITAAVSNLAWICGRPLADIEAGRALGWVDDWFDKSVILASMGEIGYRRERFLTRHAMRLRSAAINSAMDARAAGQPVN